MRIPLPAADIAFHAVSRLPRGIDQPRSEAHDNKCRRYAKMRRQPSMIVIALLAAVLAGCATYSEKASYLNGDRYYRAHIHTFPPTITAVDGLSTIRRFRYGQVPVEPGPHVIRLVTAPT